MMLLYSLNARDLVMILEERADGPLLRRGRIAHGVARVQGDPQSRHGAVGLRLLQLQPGQSHAGGGGQVDHHQRALGVEPGEEVAGRQTGGVLEGVRPGQVDGIPGGDARREYIQSDKGQYGDENEKEDPLAYGPETGTHGCSGLKWVSSTDCNQSATKELRTPPGARTLAGLPRRPDANPESFGYVITICPVYGLVRLLLLVTSARRRRPADTLRRRRSTACSACGSAGLAGAPRQPGRIRSAQSGIQRQPRRESGGRNPGGRPVRNPGGRSGIPAAARPESRRQPGPESGRSPGAVRPGTGGNQAAMRPNPRESADPRRVARAGARRPVPRSRI